MKKKILLILAGILLSMILLELGLRLAGSAYIFFQEQGNKTTAKNKDTYRILCLGESTTANEYPKFLEEELNSSGLGMHFSVIDKGRPATNTNYILANLAKYLDQYRPDMVITMMGVNDERSDVAVDESEPAAYTYKSLKIYKLVRLINIHVKSRLKQLMNRAHKPEEKGLVSEVEYVEKGHYYRGRNEYKEAEAMYKKATEKNPGYSQGYLGLGDCYRNTFRYKDAVAMFEKALDIEPGSAGNYLVLGDCYRDFKKFNEAEEMYRKALAIDPAAERAFLGLSDCYISAKRYEDAEKMCKKTIELNPKSEMGYMNLGNCYRHQGRYKEAEKLYKKMSELNPGNDQGYLNLGDCYWEEKRYEEAGELYAKVIEKNPKNEIGYINLGNSYVKQKRYKEAEEQYRKAIEINPEQEKAYFSLSILYELQKRFDEAAKILEEGMKRESISSRIFDDDTSTYAKEDKDIEIKYKKINENTRSLYFSPGTIHNYKSLRSILSERNIKYVCVQYPTREAADLKNIFESDKNIVFVDNERTFKDGVKKDGYDAYFRDKIVGEFGHCTVKGNKLLAKNIADTIIKSRFSGIPQGGRNK